MRIYCNSSRRNELDKFVGQDVWVLCEMKRVDPRTKEFYWGRIPAWIRFISKDSENYTFNLTLSSAGNDDRRHINEKEMYTSREKTLPKDRFRLVKPVQAYATDDFFQEEDEEE